MPTQYPEQQVNKLYEQLPKELQDAIFSMETADAIREIGLKYGVEDERLSEIGGYVGDVLMGLILPSQFEQTIRENVDIPGVLPEAIANEINRFIFYPVRPALEQLHRDTGQQIQITTPRHSDQNTYIAEPEEEQGTEVFSEEQKPKADSYREPIE